MPNTEKTKPGYRFEHNYEMPLLDSSVMPHKFVLSIFTTELSLSDLLGFFEQFIQSCGFCLAPGEHLDIVSEDFLNEDFVDKDDVTP